MRLELVFSRGISLPLATGLILLLMTATAAVHLLVIQTLKSAHQIEASAKAYAAAEAGIEDALYELSGHFAGYQTPALSEVTARQTPFGVKWNNRWAIQSHLGGETLQGKLFENQKINFSLFNDETDVIHTLQMTDFHLALTIPEDIVAAHGADFSSGLVINNDNDDGINEDSEFDTGSCGAGFSNNDSDCDRKENEDSAEDPVVYWKFSDGIGASLIPERGCIGETDPEKPVGSELCEKSFQGNPILAVLPFTATGVRENGETQTITEFLSNYRDGDNKQLQFEIFTVAPMEQADDFSQKKIPIPFMEYAIDYSALNGIMPDPMFQIQSDGYYQDFKQSITTTITPKTSVPLQDFTLIQQQ